MNVKLILTVRFKNNIFENVESKILKNLKILHLIYII